MNPTAMMVVDIKKGYDIRIHDKNVYNQQIIKKGL